MADGTIIKATEAGASALTVFNFASLEDQAREILDAARRQADEMLNKARTEIARMRDEERKQIAASAYEDGYQRGITEGRIKGDDEGRREGREHALREFKAQAEPAAKALAALLAQLEASRATLLQQAESDLLGLALRIGEKLARRSFEAGPQAAVSMATRLIELTADRSALDLHLAPADLEVVRAHLPAMHKAFADLRELRLHADETLQPGSARAVSRHGSVAFDLEAALQEITTALLGTGGAP